MPFNCIGKLLKYVKYLYMRVYAIILAAGEGLRFGGETPKCFLTVKGKPLFLYSLDAFQKITQIKKIILVVPEQYKSKLIIKDKRIKVVVGGKTRNESFEKGMKSLRNLERNDKILVHDAARPNVQHYDIQRLINSNEDFGTLCYIGGANDRDLRYLNYNIQTPQFCRKFIYKKAKKDKVNGKDLFTYLGLKPSAKNFFISSNQESNFKVTFPEDLEKLKSL